MHYYRYELFDIPLLFEEAQLKAEEVLRIYCRIPTNLQQLSNQFFRKICRRLCK